MKIRLRWVLPVILVTLAGCAGGGGDHTASADPPAIAAPTQRVNAVSQAVGARMDNMLGTQHSPTSTGTR
jgi:hypothetical protein